METYRKDKIMDNKGIIFALGALIGAAGGSIGTYFLVKGRFEAERDEAIEEYAEHAEKRLERQIEALKGHSEEDVEEKPDHGRYKMESEVEDPDERKINNNEGVKKYHHYDGDQLPEYASKRVFKKYEEKPKVKESKLVNEISAEEFEQENEDYTKQTLDILLRLDDSYEAIWGYQTDNQTTCKAKFGKDLEEMFGTEIIEQLLDATPADEGIGILYFRNDELMTDFELVLHSDEETYYANERE